MSKRRKRVLVQLTLKEVRRGAYILGEHSCYAKALREYDRRIGDGLATAFYSVGNGLVVGDPIPDEAAMRKMEA